MAEMQQKGLMRTSTSSNSCKVSGSAKRHGTFYTGSAVLDIHDSIAERQCGRVERHGLAIHKTLTQNLALLVTKHSIRKRLTLFPFVQSKEILIQNKTSLIVHII